MLTFVPGRYCSNIWFIDVPAMNCNILAALFRDPDHWTLIYRFRYDAGTNDPWDGQDRKNWYTYHASLEKTESELLDYTRQCWHVITELDDTEVHSLPVRSDDPGYIMDQLTAQPWANTRPLHDAVDKEAN